MKSVEIINAKKNQLLCLSFISLWLVSCSHLMKSSKEVPATAATTIETEKSSSALPTESAKTDPSGTRAELNNGLTSFHLDENKSTSPPVAEFDSIPSEVNPLVDKWIAYFQGRGRPHMERYLARSTRYELLMKKVLRDNGLPEDLFYIALIESGFTSSATSHASAVGYWQFIRGTGKRYGLEINKFVDERRDPVVATQAAADYFRELYKMFGSWYLAMASYNVGEGKVRRESLKNDTRDFWEIAKKKRLPKETVNYIPKYIAARMIAKNPDKYGFDGIDYMPPIEFDSMTFESPINLKQMAEKMNYNYEDLKALNPKFKGEVATLSNNKLSLRIPVGSLEQAKLAAAESKVDKVEFIADTGNTQVYKIRRGDSLHTIARKFRTTVAYLRDLNDIPRKKKLRAGSRIFVPDRSRAQQRNQVAASTTTQELSPQSKPEILSDGDVKYYIVQNGDSLFSIAQKYNTSVQALKKINQIRRGRVLKVGIKLKLPNVASEKESKGKVEPVVNTLDSSQKKVKKTHLRIVKR